ncbi:MAG: YegP family protein [Kofleriaceae bacterium]|nr:YegP family protein [Kofleriaceae bacterium]
MRNVTSLITALVLSVSSMAAVGCAGADDVDAIEDGEATAAGKLAFSKDAGGKWRFNVKAGNGSVLLSSEAYTSRTGAINGALSVLENGVDPAQYLVNKTTTGWNIHLRAGNNESIAFSQVYATKSSATRAVTSSVRAVTTYLDKKEAASTGARVEVLQGASGKYRFNIHAKNGEIVLSSEQYSSDAAAYNGAFAVQAEAKNAAAYELKENAGGGFYFTVKAQNGEIIGVSQQYATKSSAESGVASLKSFLPTVTVL